MQNLPDEIFEAAELDGAARWQQVRYLTIPLLQPTTLFVSTIAAVGSIQMVDQIYIMTQGGPSNASNLLLFYIYETAFRFRNLGVANAATVILVLLLLIFTVANFTISERRTNYRMRIQGLRSRGAHAIRDCSPLHRRIDLNARRSRTAMERGRG